MTTDEKRANDYSGFNDPLNDLVLTWILALVTLAALSVALPS